MAKKKEDNKAMYLILGILVGIVAVALLGNQLLKGGLSGGTPGGSNTDNPSNIDDEYDDYMVTLYITPSVICSGDVITGTLNTNIPYGTCSIFMNAGLGWMFLANANLDNSGHYSETSVVDQVGHAVFRAVCCDDENNCKISNEVPLTVQNCGSTTTTLMSSPTTTLAQVPQQYQCYDSDGGINYNEWGYCEDDYHQLGFADMCEDGQLKEYYCDDDGICQHVYGASCGGGYACSGIKYPSSQGSCNPGYCSQGGYCAYYPATLSTPAYCGCMLMV